MEQPPDTHADGAGHGFITEADMALYRRGSEKSRAKFYSEERDCISNPFFRALKTRFEGLPVSIYPPVHGGIQVRESPIHGKGMFCIAKSIPAGTFLCAYPGRVTTKESDSQYTVQVYHDLNIFIEGSCSKFAVSEAERTAHYFNSIARWDGTVSGGANCCMRPNYPHWPYVVVYTLRKIQRGEELLLDYHWFDTITSKEPCHPSCKSCFA